MVLTPRKVLKRAKWYIRELLPPISNVHRRGRKSFRRDAIVIAYVLGFLRGISTIRGLVRYLNEHEIEARQCGFYKGIPSVSTFSRARRELSPDFFEVLLGRMIREYTKHVGKRIPCIAIDSTPLEAYRARDEDARLGYSVDGRFFGYKIHVAVDARREIPLAVIITPGNEHDSPWLPRLLEKVRNQRIRFGVVIADAGYDSKENYEAIASCNVLPIIKKNKRNEKHGKHVKPYRTSIDQKKWNSYYRLRTSAERVFSRAKEVLRLREHAMQGLSITVLVLSVIIAMLTLALTALWIRKPELMLKVGMLVHK
jgi:hypothetical protein